MTSFSGATVLVTGGAGFIGSEVARQLCAQNAVVILVDNLVNGKRTNVESLLGPSCRLETVDVRDDSVMAGLLAGADLCLHLACLGVRHSIHSPWENHEVNATATLHLLAAARSAGVRRFVYVSSSEIYGPALRVPMTEEHPPFPMTVYGAAKLAGECYTRAFHRTYGYATTVVRPFNAYGPRCHHEGDCGEVIPKFLLRCLAGEPMVVFGDGKQTRDFTFVGDTARGILAAAASEAAVGETLNLGNGSEISINALADEVKIVAGRPDAVVVHDRPRPGDVDRLFADTAKVRALLGFEPQVPLRDGLRRLREWYDSQGVAPRDLLVDEVVRNWERAVS